MENNIEYLEWDSLFFGIKIGKLIINDEKDFDPLVFKDYVKNNNFSLVYVFKKDRMLSAENIFKSELRLVDIQPTMSMKFDREAYKGVDYKLYNALENKELQDSYKIAEQTAAVSRFYNEISIGSDKTKLLYRKWVDNALNQSFSDGVFLEKQLDNITGIHIIKTDLVNKIGHFTLTGVNSDYKRQGIGRKLWLQSFGYWANESDVEIVKSPFSFQNLDSLNFHLGLGFTKVDEVKYIYHYSQINY